MTIPALNLPPPALRSNAGSLFPNLNLATPSPSTTTSTLFGAAPNARIGILHELLAVQIATILLGKETTQREREMERNRPVLVGIGLKKLSGTSGEEEEGIGEGDRRLFAGVMGMVVECTTTS